MTHMETARINEMLGLQIGLIQDLARKLDTNDLEQLEGDLAEMERAVSGLRDTLGGLPHKRV